MTTLDKLVNDFLANRAKGLVSHAEGNKDDVLYYITRNSEISDIAYKKGLDREFTEALRKAGVLI